jgi:hypothetical protein
LQSTRTHVQDTAQLSTFIRGANEDFESVEEISELVPMKEKQVLMKSFSLDKPFKKLRCLGKKWLGY